jgi:hypothetical protein
MARKPLLIAVLAAMVFFSLCCAAYAQDEAPTQPVEEEQAQEPGNIYFFLNDELVPVPRDITGGNQMVEFALLELLKGPTEEEKAAGYVTYIPEGVKLQYTTIKQDRSEFSVNLSRELMELSGDADSSAKALEQIVKTAQDISGITNIWVTVAGEAMGDTPQDAFEALGVEKKDAGTEGQDSETSEESGNGLLVLWIVLGALAGVLLVALLVIYLKRRKRPAGSATGRKAAGSKKAKSKTSK